MLKTLYESLGLTYGALILLSGLVVTIVSVIVVRKARTPTVLKTCKASIPTPFYIGLFASVQGLISVFYQIAKSNIAVADLDVIPLLFTVVSPALAGLLLSLPAYVLITLFRQRVGEDCDSGNEKKTRQLEKNPYLPPGA